MKVIGAIAAAWAFYRALHAPPTITISSRASEFDWGHQLEWLRDFVSAEVRANDR